MAITKKTLISIQPQWVEKILNGEKTIEIRKTMPKCELPVKVYIYAIKSSRDAIRNISSYRFRSGICFDIGKVVAEFTLKWCDKRSIAGLTHSPSDFNTFLKRAGINWYKNSKEFYDYVSKKDYIYAWYISDLKIYDKPKELGEFRKFCGNNGQGCPDSNCPYYEEPSYEYGEVNHECDFMKPLTKAPQSWCYVEGESL